MLVAIAILLVALLPLQSLANCPPACGAEGGKPYVPHTQQAQGVYVDSLTVTESERAVARVSTSADTTTLTVLNLVTSAIAYSATIDSSEQNNGSRAWVNAGWPRGVTLPALPKGLYTVAVSSGVVSPNNVDLSHDTYRGPLFVTSSAPTADFLVVVPSLTSACYNTWPNYPRYVAAGATGKSCYENPDATEVSTRIGLKRPGFDSKYYNRPKIMIDRIEANGYTWDIIDETHLEANPSYLNNFQSIIIVEQIEYATFELREAYDDYLDQGGRVLVIGNEIWIWNMRKEGDAYRVFKLSDDPYMVDGDPSNDHQIGKHSVIGDKFPVAGPNNPETTSAGVSFWLGGNPAIGVTAWTAYRTGHWFYAGTGLSDEGTFGDLATTDFTDGVRVQFTGTPTLPYYTDAATYHIPTTLLILATADTDNSTPWDCVTVPFTNVACQEDGEAVIAIWEKEPNNGVFMVIPVKTWLTDLDATTTRMLDNTLDAFAASGIFDILDGESVTP